MSLSYFFIFSPPNSGTTVMSQFLARNIHNSYIPTFGNNEGQFAPNVKKIMRNGEWEEESNFDWEYIKSEWDKLMIAEKKCIFIEASPPNIMRVKEILKFFPSSKFVFSISSPYSFVASFMYNYKKDINEASKFYIKTAKKQILNIDSFDFKPPRITYEEFCNDPNTLLRKFDIKCTQDSSNDSFISGKGNSKISKLINNLPKHLSYLGFNKIIELNNILLSEPEVLNYFGYQILNVEQCDQIIRQNPLLANEGSKRNIEEMIELKLRFSSKIKKLIKNIF